MKSVYKTNGTCSSHIELEIVDGLVKEVQFWGGCNGNLQGISKLVCGMSVDEVVTKLAGIRCSGRSTSCPDQLTEAIKKAKDNS